MLSKPVEPVQFQPDFRTLFESCPGLYLVLLPDTPRFTIVGVSNAYLWATMTSRNEIIGQGIFNVFPDNPKDPLATGVRNLRTSLDRVVLSKVSDTMAIQKYDIQRPETKGGGFEERFWSPVNSPILGLNGELLYIIHRVEDVTEFVHLRQRGFEQEKLTEELKKRAEQMEMEILLRARELEDSNSRGQLARVILDRMFQFVALLDVNGNLLEVNQATLDAVGLKRQEVLGLQFWILPTWQTTSENPDKVRRACVRAAKGEFVRDEIDLLASAVGSQRITVDFSLMPIRDEKGKISFLLAEARNIAEKKLAEAEIEKKNLDLSKLNERLRQLDRLKSQFFANVSHELRTPLTLILGPASKMLDDQNLSEEQRKDLEIIIRNGQLLLKHVNDLLDVARLEEGKITPAYVEFDLTQLIQSVARHFMGIANDRKILLKIETPNSMLLQADPNLIQRILLNLIGNAFKFTPSGGQIILSIKKEGEYVYISVQDNGPGVPRNLREVIFERFKQVEGGSTRKFGGTGLGLSIAKEFTELHHGSIYVTDAPGGGALFITKIPLTAPVHVRVGYEIDRGLVEQRLPSLKEVQGSFLERTEAPLRAKGTVLVVEDNPDLNRFLANFLSSEYKIESAFNGKEGLEKALKLKPDLIISDIMMPEMSGDQMLAEMRKHADLDDVPVLLLTAKADDQLRVQLLKGGAQDYVIKPFFLEEVIARITNLISVKKAKELLQQKVESQSHDIVELAKQIILKAEALQRALQSRDEFLSMASHELKTPITSLLLQLQLLNREVKPQEGKAPAPENLKKAFSMSIKQVNSLTNLVDNLLDVSKVRLGKMACVPVNVNVSQVIRDVAERFSEQLNTARIHLDLELDKNIQGFWDPYRFEQVMNNLISNVIKYAPGKPAKITSSLKGTMAVITVEDSGPGILKEKHRAIFERFERASTPSISGLGLGLYIVKGIVESHKGSIRVESEVGEGTKFIIELPLRLEVDNFDLNLSASNG